MSEVQAPTELAVHPTEIPGLLKIDLAVYGDERGWFKEGYQRTRLAALGVPPLDVVQSNISFNAPAGVTRGVHAEPWDKYVTLATGRAFVAIVDLRAGGGFGRLATFEVTPADALFVPRGCGNSFQTLEPATAYVYFVNGQWSAAQSYLGVYPFDEELAIPWPIGGERAIVSARDRAHPLLRDVAPVPQ